MAITSDSIGLLFKAKGDTDDAQKAFRDFKKEIDAIEKAAKDAGTPMQQLGASAGLTAGQYKELAGTLPIVGAAITGITTVVAGAVVGLFNLAKSASDFGSEIFDATQKTGLAAETISSIKVAADQSGTSLDAVTGGLARFARTIGDAGNGSDKAQAKLKNLGVTSKDLDTALGEALVTIAKYPPGVQQMTAAQDAFGKSGVDLLPFIKSFDGDLPGLIAKCKELGLTMTDADARAADEFGDQMDTLNAQLASVARTIGIAVIPTFLELAREVGGWLKENKDTISLWAGTVNAALKGVIYQWQLYGWAIKQAYEASHIFKGGIPIFTEPPNAPNFTPAAPTAQEFSSSGGGRSQALLAEDEEKKAADKRAKDREAAFQRELAAQSKHNSLLLAGARSDFAEEQRFLEEQFIKKEITAAEYRERSIKALNEYQDKINDLITKSYETDSTGKSGQEVENLREQANQAIEALNREIAKEHEDREKTITAVSKREANQRVADAKKSNSDIVANAQSVTNTLISQFDVMKAKGILTERQYTEVVSELKLRQLELERVFTDDAQKRFRLDEQIKQFKNQMVIEGIELTNQEAEATRDAAQAYREYQESVWNASMKQAEFRAQQNETVESASGMTTLLNMFRNAFNGVAQALGNVVQQWVLYGKTGPAVMKQVLASALAAIAAEATVRAIYALAMGFFFLATHQYTDATNAFIAAAVFGSIGIGAALAGRAIAGNSGASSAVAQESSGAYGSAGSGANRPPGQGEGNDGGVYSSQEDLIVERDRNTPSIPVSLALKIQLDSNGVLELIKDSVRSNGSMRDLILDAG